MGRNSSGGTATGIVPTVADLGQDPPSRNDRDLKRQLQRNSLSNLKFRCAQGLSQTTGGFALREIFMMKRLAGPGVADLPSFSPTACAPYLRSKR